MTPQSTSDKAIRWPATLWISRSFWSGAVLTFVGLVSCGLAVLLIAVGDRAGASAVWGVFLVSAVAWVINFVALVAMLAWRAMQEDHTADSTNSRGS